VLLVAGGRSGIEERECKWTRTAPSHRSPRPTGFDFKWLVIAPACCSRCTWRVAARLLLWQSFFTPQTAAKRRAHAGQLPSGLRLAGHLDLFWNSLRFAIGRRCWRFASDAARVDERAHQHTFKALFFALSLIP